MVEKGLESSRGPINLGVGNILGQTALSWTAVLSIMGSFQKCL
jgi:hypothetical protein